MLRFYVQVSLHHNKLVQHPHYCRQRPSLSVSLMFHSPLTREEDPKILLHLLQFLVLHPLPTLCHPRAMVSDLEVQIIIPAPLHSASNYSSASWRSPPDEGNRSTIQSCEKLCHMLDLKISLAGKCARHSQCILTIHLGTVCPTSSSTT